ncbi:deoxyguanosinetriphosphate triphosphohydrolase [Marivirga lumbricoides]|uniref:Deoxyguanosinetriphosphate triphosphohydrolase n=1 Tax=Marivirga lumbricoides TaxID=1046115 RepID=A0A2T4DK69_9BACT|nr:deoxyguanosinetriphosphate triphosphohydrolase [Marivirga lumbricoides]
MEWIKLLNPDRLGQSGKNAQSSARSFFEQDYDRIIFSHPFRRLQDKTQVVPLPEEDFVHTRLTHSLEVSSVGRSLGKKVGEVITEKYPELKEAGFSAFDFGAIVAAASLSHDIGNPPFGHSGEDAISDFFEKSTIGKTIKAQVSEAEWKDLTNFEGNAQGFRLLNRPDNQGIKLTLSTLAAFTKYPRPSLISERDKSRRSQKKYGFFQSEKDIFTELAEAVGLLRLSHSEAIYSRHPLTFLVEAADDICYHIIDLEDGCRLGWVPFEQARDLLAEILGESYMPEKLEKTKGKNEKIGYLRALAINALIEQCVNIFKENEAEILSGQFDTALMDLVPSKKVLRDIIAVSVQKIYRSRLVLETEAVGHVVLEGLLSSFLEAAIAQKGKEDSGQKDLTVFRLLPEAYQEMITETGSFYEISMICIDYISGMTDRYAITLYRKLKGISLPG